MPRRLIVATPKTPARLAAEKLCRKFPEAPSRTLAKRVAAEQKISIESARNMIRAIRGTHGEINRKKSTDKSLFQSKGRAG